MSSRGFVSICPPPPFLITYTLFVYACAWAYAYRRSMCRPEDTLQESVHSPASQRVLGLNSDCQAVWQEPLPPEPACWAPSSVISAESQDRLLKSWNFIDSQGENVVSWKSVCILASESSAHFITFLSLFSPRRKSVRILTVSIAWWRSMRSSGGWDFGSGEWLTRGYKRSSLWQRNKTLKRENGRKWAA